MNICRSLLLCCALAFAGAALACGDLAALMSEPAEDSSLQLLNLLDTLPQAPLRDDVGNSAMPISTRSEPARRYFNQGLALLYDYWEFEALRAFRHAIRHDPMAAMPYWGVYLASAQMLRRAARFASPAPFQLRSEVLQAAMALAGAASALEQMHIQAIADWHYKGGDAYRQALENILLRFPGDVQAQLFLAEHLRYGYAADGRPRPGQLRGENILRDLIKAEPENHAAHHYWIHAIEKSNTVTPAAGSARQIAALAPGSGHIVHMPGHVFFRQGDYQRARASFLQSARADEAYLRASRVPVIYNWSRVHNLHYLALNSAEQGRYRDGLREARKAQALARAAAQHRDYASGTFFDQGLLAPAKLEIRFGHWPRAVDELQKISVDEAQYGAIAVLYYQSLLAFARAKAALTADDIPEAKRQLAELPGLQAQAGALLEARRIPDWLAPVIAVMALELRAGVALAQDGADSDSATALLQQAMAQEQAFAHGSDPPRNIRPVAETAAGAWLARGQWQKSRSVYAALLAARPNSGFALFGLARSYDKAGNSQQALAAYRRFLSLWQYADNDLPSVQTAKQRVAALSQKTAGAKTAGFAA